MTAVGFPVVPEEKTVSVTCCIGVARNDSFSVANSDLSVIGSSESVSFVKSGMRSANAASFRR